MIIQILLIILITICMITDIKGHKVYNKVILPFIILGPILNIIFYGLDGAKNSLIGFIIPIVIFFPLHMFKMIGAGDIKLFATIGALMGYKFLASNMVYSFFGAGIVCIFYIVKNRNLLERLKYFFSFIFNSVLTKSVNEYDKEKSKIPFALGVFIGTIAQLIIKYDFWF
ncbi:prepilin peptidase CpaA [Clostridium cavendishii DSM 21758]|uniref:Prepilin peptidase CpaA n=1 Tax=Clostridium cavendishii DSM 21758 TaxID=1121302 RepID=A0A1M6QG87_9CLOT|nr:A24 family peptidase [Clostridium cavendishii]SHK19231.1 prepilin peptidase CpaA [Clostridium cavendishii DSM 21758]